MKLHVFGCSVTQGFALPDVVRTLVDDQGVPLSERAIREDPSIAWTDIHIYEPSQYAWPQVLANSLGVEVENYARRGSCFRQIARQIACALPTIQPEDVAIVMWTYCSRLSIQWPARTTVPFCTEVDTSAWSTVTRGFNKLFGLEPAKDADHREDEYIQKYIEQSVLRTHLDPLAQWDRYYNNLVVQSLAHASLTGVADRVIHLSVEPHSVEQQLAEVQQQLPQSLQEWQLPKPHELTVPQVDHDSCRVILDPSIPTAENDMHPSVEHHRRFADHCLNKYW